MTKKVRKICEILAVFTMLLTYICIFIIYQDNERPKFYFLNIGQGDAILIKLPGLITILIDGGPDNLVLRRLGGILPFYRRKIDILILSHPHDDHIIGLIEIVRRYKVGALIYMWQDDAPDLLNILLSEAAKRNVKIIGLKDSASLNYQNNCTINIMNPEGLGIKEDANNSLITKINCAGVSALFTGDNNSEVENKLIQTGQDLSAQILKAAHHGSKTANSVEFLQAVSPSLYIISVGALNRFGHPNQEIIERVQNLGIMIKRTDKDGTVEIN